MSTGRKLHARRGAEGEGNNSSNSNRTTSPVFVWASERTNSASPVEPSLSEAYGVQQTDRSLQPDSSNSPVKPAVNSRSTCTNQHAAVGNNNEFKWISDYIEDSEDEESARHSQGSGLRTETYHAGHGTGVPTTGPCAQPVCSTRAGQQQRRLQHQSSRPAQQGTPTASTAAAAAAAAGLEAAAAGGAGGAAASAGRWLGASAATALDRLTGYDPSLNGRTVAAAAAAAVPASHAANPAVMQLSSQQQRQQQQQEAQPEPVPQHRYLTRRRVQAQRQSSGRTQLQQQQRLASPQQQQQQQQQTGSSQGWVLAVAFGLIALLSDAVTAVTTAYTESVKPGAELLWHIAAALLLYLLLPLLRLLLAAVRFLLMGFGRVVKSVNSLMGTRLTKAVGKQKCGTSQTSKGLWGYVLSGCTAATAGRVEGVAPSQEQQQLLLLAQKQLDTLTSKYTAGGSSSGGSSSSSGSVMWDFERLYSSTGGLCAGRLLDPDAGYGPCTFKGQAIAAAGAAAAGQAVAVQVQPLAAQQAVVQQWCSVVDGLMQLKQAAAAAAVTATVSGAEGTGGSVNASPVLQMSGAAVGFMSAAAVAAAGIAGPQQQQQQQQSVAVLAGLIAVPLLPQAQSLLSRVRDAEGVTSLPQTAAAAAGQEPAVGTGVMITASDRVQAACQRIQLAPLVGAAVQQLCTLLGSCRPAAAAADAGKAGHAEQLLLSVSALQLAECVLIRQCCVASEQPAEVVLNPLPLLLHAQLASGGASPAGVSATEKEIKVLLQALQQLHADSQSRAGSGLVPAAAAAGPNSDAVAVGIGGLSVRECVRRLEQHLRDRQVLQSQAATQALPADMTTPSASATAPNPSSSSSSSSSRAAQSSLMQALSGVLLILLTGDAGQGALLAPGNSLYSPCSTGYNTNISSTVSAADGTGLALSLQQLQYSRLRRVVQQGEAAALLTASRPNSLQQQQPQWKASPQVKASLGQISQDLLQQVLLCWEWGAASKAACSGSGNSSSDAAAAGSAERLNSSTQGFCRTAAAAAADADAERQPSYTSGIWGTLRKLTGHQTAVTAATNTPASRLHFQQQHQQQQQQGVALPAPFDWPQLQQALQQCAQSAAAYMRLLRAQSAAPPAAYLCPISHELMCDPVVASDGHTYERKAITEWIQACAARRAPTKSPMTLLAMQPQLLPNHSLRSLIQDWQQQQQQ